MFEKKIASFIKKVYNSFIKYFKVKKEKELMTFRAISRQDGSIGAEMYSSNLINILLAETRKKKAVKRTALEVVDATMNTKNLSEQVLDKYNSYRAKIAQMDLPSAVRYTSNFYKKGLATYLPVGAIN